MYKLHYPRLIPSMLETPSILYSSSEKKILKIEHLCETEVELEMLDVLNQETRLVQSMKKPEVRNQMPLSLFFY
jgi:hypothetical protein